MRNTDDIVQNLDGKKEFVEPKDDAPKRHVFEWNGHSWTFYARAIDYAQEIAWQRRLAQMAGNVEPRFLENYNKLRAIAIVRTVFDDIPKWLMWLMLNDDEVAIAIANKIEERTYSFRAKHGAARDAETGEERFSISE